MKKTIISAALLFASFATFAQGWSVDKAHAKLGFSITHMMISEVDGSFKTFDAKITASKEDFSDAVIELTADVNSINTDNDRRDGHLKGPDFFEAAKFGTLTFKSTQVTKGEGKKLKVVGDLTMHGVTKPVTLDLTLNGTAMGRNNKKSAGFKATAIIKRSDFGIGSNMPAAMLGDEVELRANGEFVQN
jgi:polyisoprenoid-binding protein YceI